jgi:predicted TIM-barrel fold metal-dependent hydrolase
MGRKDRSALRQVMNRCLAFLALVCAGAMVACASPGRRDASAATGADPDLSAFIAKIKAVDNHSHANSMAPGDTDADALPLDGIAPFEIPAPLRPDNPDWFAAYRALYGYPHADLSDAHLAELRGTMRRVARKQGEKFPAWVLDQIGTEVLLANRIAMGPGLAPPRVRWVSYVDALMLPLSTKAEAASSPDRAKLFPLEDALLQRYLSDLKIARVPGTLEAYLKTVVTPTLEAQRKGGAVAVKFEAAYLRALDFDDVPAEAAGRIYAKYAGGGVPSHGEYKALQDFLFRYIAREAGRLGMAVHIHAFEGAGNYFDVAGADPLLLEPVFDDPSLRKTTFVIIHGGGVFSAHGGALLWKPNVYVDMSLMTLAYPPGRLAVVLRDWLTQYPEKVLFGSDAVALGPDMGWEVAAWVGTRNARTALALALTEMVRSGEVNRSGAEAIATMVMRTNAGRLYGLELGK